MRGTVLTVLRIVGNNVLRLGSNLILTRLLFPEAFGMMALVQVFMSGLQMFSDIGLRASVVQNARGDEPDFLNTIWTMKVIRGFILWAMTCILALPAANFYNEPMLAYILPVVGFSAAIGGFITTNVLTADKHLQLGRLTVIELSCYAASIVVTIVLAYITGSVWALVLGGIAATVFKLIAMQILMPGIRNRFRWEPEAFSEIFNFGKFIFLSTVAGFALKQSDKIILGKYLTLGDLGIYTIGLTLATLPFMLSRAVSDKIVFPLYSKRQTNESGANRTKMLKARRLAIALTLPLATILAFSGLWLVDVLYDERYIMAGPVVVLYSFVIVPQLVTDNYRAAMFASGNSHQFFYVTVFTIVLQLSFLLIGLSWFGLFGAICALGLSILLTYPLLGYFVRQRRALDFRGDMFFLTLGFCINGLACWLHRDAISQLIS